MLNFNEFLNKITNKFNKRFVFVLIVLCIRCIVLVIAVLVVAVLEVLEAVFLTWPTINSSKKFCLRY